MVDTTDIDKLARNIVKLSRDEKGKMKIALTVHAKVKRRIFGFTKDSTGKPIGQYSEGYMRLRRKAGHTANKNIALRGVSKVTPKGTPRGKNRYVTSGQMQEDFQVINICDG